MHVSYDLSKREKALADRGLDFEDAVVVFDGLTVEVEDTRKDYGEKRIICYGNRKGSTYPTHWCHLVPCRFGDWRSGKWHPIRL